MARIRPKEGIENGATKITALTVPAAMAIIVSLDMRHAQRDHAAYLLTKGSSARLRARLIARANSRCLLAETAEIRLGTILPRSERKRCKSFTSL